MGNEKMQRILVTGALGQIGTDLTTALRNNYGADNVIASDIRPAPEKHFSCDGPFVQLDVTSSDAIERILRNHKIDSVFHLAALLSAVGEKNPQACWDVNMGGVMNMLNLGVKLELNRLIIPSSIAVWGPDAPKENTPQETCLQPTSMYGVTKVCGELVCDYYVEKFGLDVRGLRYPGIISYETLPGGGTTDYAVAIYYDAVDKGGYTCFVKEDTRLPMMYMPDTIMGTIQLAEAPFENLKHHSNFNMGSMSFTAGELAAEIRKHLPDFTVRYEPDYRQKIADSWPASIDDSCAREEWGWEPQWNLATMTKDMLEKLQARKDAGTLYR